MYKVIFNNDKKNYEEFKTLAEAERFASSYCNTQIVKEEA